MEKLENIPTSAIDRAAETLLNLRESWQKAPKEEQRELVQMIFQEVGCSIVEERLVWVKPRRGFELLFQIAIADKILIFAEDRCLLPKDIRT